MGLEASRGVSRCRHPRALLPVDISRTYFRLLRAATLPAPVTRRSNGGDIADGGIPSASEPNTVATKWLQERQSLAFD